MITKDNLAEKLILYLNHDLSLNDLVQWAEWVMMEEYIDEKDMLLIRDVIARLGLSDTMAFGLSFEDCREYLEKLGYDVEITVKKAEVS